MKLSRILYICLLLASSIYAYAHFKEQMNDEIKDSIALQESYIERIKLAIFGTTQSLEAFERLSSFHDSVLTTKEFSIFSSIMYDPQKFHYISFAPGGIVTYAHPPEESSTLLGKNLVESPSVFMNDNESPIQLTGPTCLNKDDEAIIIRSSIQYNEQQRKKFWGYATIALRSPKFLSVTGLFALENIGYQFSLLSSHEGKPIKLLETSDFHPGITAYKEFKVYDSTWQFSIYQEGRQKEILLNSLWLFALLLLVTSLICRSLNHLENRNQQYKKQLNYDKLTGAYNRRFLEEFSFPKEYTIFYIDLNKFKPVNDTYGHDVGDKVLIAYVERLKRRFKVNTVFVRMGGDEFLVLMEKALNPHELQNIKSRLAAIADEVFVIGDLKIQIGSSIGYAIFPNDADDLKTLIDIADKMMYHEKQSERHKGKIADFAN